MGRVRTGIRQDGLVPRHVTHVPLRWADMDAYGHVNNVVYLRYLQEARVDMLFVHAPQQGAEQLAEGVVVAKHEISYHAQLRFRAQPVRVETWVRQINNSTFTLGYEVLDLQYGGGGHGLDGGKQLTVNGSENVPAEPRRTVYAVATTVLVPYDLDGVYPRRVAADERKVLETFLELDGPTPGRNAV